MHTNQKIILFCMFFLTVGLFSCSKSGRRHPLNSNNSVIRDERYKDRNNGIHLSGKTVIKMVKKNGVYQIPVDVNGVRMSFIFDTGASSISISNTEAIFLVKQGLLTSEDVIGSQSFSDANGDISEGTIINLRSIKIGNRTLTNIQANVVDNLNAPLLFGQTALSQFGKISIDNTLGEVTFE